MADVADKLVDQQVRCRGTLGGNCCLNDPASNYPPLLVALGATMRMATLAGQIDVPAEEFFLGPYATAAGGAVLASVVVPALGEDERVGYQSVQLAEDSWALARAAVWVKGDETIDRARVVLGCLAGGPSRLHGVERVLTGASADAPTAKRAREAVAEEEVRTVSDAHGSDEYRRMLAGVVVERALREAMNCEEVVA
jgi:carbon-monoxide dehydrogenase medium subunit